MAGVDVGGGGGKRRSLDSEINMIPMIDLLMVTISFLLITAVWTHMSRINADAQVPGPPQPEPPDTPKVPEKQLHVEMRDKSKFTLIWKQGQTVVTTESIPRDEETEAKMMAGIGTPNKARIVSYPALEAKINEQWKQNSNHNTPNDAKLDQAVLHTDNQEPYAKIIGVIDAIYKTQRVMEVEEIEGGRKTKKKKELPAFNVTFSVN